MGHLRRRRNSLRVRICLSAKIWMKPLSWPQGYLMRGMDQLKFGPYWRYSLNKSFHVFSVSSSEATELFMVKTVSVGSGITFHLFDLIGIAWCAIRLHGMDSASLYIGPNG